MHVAKALGLPISVLDNIDALRLFQGVLEADRGQTCIENSGNSADLCLEEFFDFVLSDFEGKIAYKSCIWRSVEGRVTCMLTGADWTGVDGFGRCTGSSIWRQLGFDGHRLRGAPSSKFGYVCLPSFVCSFGFT